MRHKVKFYLGSRVISTQFTVKIFTAPAKSVLSTFLQKTDVLSIGSQTVNCLTPNSEFFSDESLLKNRTPDDSANMAVLSTSARRQRSYLFCKPGTNCDLTGIYRSLPTKLDVTQSRFLCVAMPSPYTQGLVLSTDDDEALLICVSHYPKAEFDKPVYDLSSYLPGPPNKCRMWHKTGFLCVVIPSSGKKCP